jgi:hypothetical protein
MPESDNPTVVSWQDTLKGIAGDFGRVAADNLRKQTDKDAAQARIESPNKWWQTTTGGWVAIGLALVVGWVVAKKLLR